MEDNDSRTLWCGNLSPEVTEDLLYELFLQAGPLERVCIPKNPNGYGNRNYGFVTFRHAVSVKYAVDLMQGVSLFERILHVRCRTQNQNSSTPVSTRGPSTSSSSVGRYGGPQLSSSRRCAELIELDSDNGSQSTRHNRPRAFNDYRRHHSFDGGSAISPHQNQFAMPSPPMIDMRHQQRFYNDQQKILRDPWKPHQDSDEDRRHHHHHHSSPSRPHFDRHNSWSPYGGQPYRRF